MHVLQRNPHRVGGGNSPLAVGTQKILDRAEDLLAHSVLVTTDVVTAKQVFVPPHVILAFLNGPVGFHHAVTSNPIRADSQPALLSVANPEHRDREPPAFPRERISL